MREFGFFPCELSSKFRAKVRMTIRGVLSEISVEQRALFRRKVWRNFEIKSLRVCHNKKSE